MNAEQYRAVIGWFNARPAAKKALRLVSRSAVALVYLLYLGMLAWLAWHRMGQLWPALVVPASAFVVGTLVRKLIDRPRPYTALGFTPLFPKDKTGQSMPSRHCFSAAAIAGTAWYVLPPLGAVLAVLGVLIAISRVVTGVHYISDVLAGLAFGGVFAVLGWNAFVLAAFQMGAQVVPPSVLASSVTVVLPTTTFSLRPLALPLNWKVMDALFLPERSSAGVMRHSSCPAPQVS